MAREGALPMTHTQPRVQALGDGARRGGGSESTARARCWKRQLPWQTAGEARTGGRWSDVLCEAGEGDTDVATRPGPSASRVTRNGLRGGAHFPAPGLWCH